MDMYLLHKQPTMTMAVSHQINKSMHRLPKLHSGDCTRSNGICTDSCNITRTGKEQQTVTSAVSILCHLQWINIGCS